MLYRVIMRNNKMRSQFLSHIRAARRIIPNSDVYISFLSSFF